MHINEIVCVNAFWQLMWKATLAKKISKNGLYSAMESFKLFLRGVFELIIFHLSVVRISQFYLKSTSPVHLPHCLFGAVYWSCVNVTVKIIVQCVWLILLVCVFACRSSCCQGCQRSMCRIGAGTLSTPVAMTLRNL